jgi:hypothetical protein
MTLAYSRKCLSGRLLPTIILPRQLFVTRDGAALAKEGRQFFQLCDFDTVGCGGLQRAAKPLAVSCPLPPERSGHARRACRKDVRAPYANACLVGVAQRRQAENRFHRTQQRVVVIGLLRDCAALNER